MKHPAALLFLIFVAGTAMAPAQTDPGPRQGPGPMAGRPLPNLTPGDLAYFVDGARRFREVDSVSGTQPGAPGSGLGPRFNMNSCAGCHAHPAPGGTSPALNPQIAVAIAYGAQNTIPSFIQSNGPVRVARYIDGPNGPDGGVKDLFTITGRSDAAGCRIDQPNFAAAVAIQNVIFRIPTPLFGAGLIEAIPDSAILANLAANQQLKRQFGIRGLVNRGGNDGTITRFGWKAQNKSLLLFAGEAYNVEQGVTNEIFPTERDETSGCVFNATPEDHIDHTANTVTGMISDLLGITEFMRLLAPPDPAPATPVTTRGSDVFNQIGCNLCHTPALKTGRTQIAALSERTVPLYSDLALHNMGPRLADRIDQGLARGGDWRTAPLWGLGQRLFLLHDGRTQDLAQAIREHASPGSEGTPSVNAFEALTPQQKQDLLVFLRSL